MDDLKMCPHCGGTLGLYSKEMNRYDQFYKWDGTPDGYSDGYGGGLIKSTPLYCLNCNKKVTTLEKLEVGNGK